MFKRIRYFSIAVTDLDEAVAKYEKLFGLKLMTEPNVQRWGFKGVMIGNGEDRMVEVIQPTDPDSALSRFMKERAIPSNPNGEGIYLVSIEVDDIKETVKQIQEQGGRVTMDEQSSNTAWVHPTSSNFAFMEITQPSP